MNLYQVAFRVLVPVAIGWPQGVPYDPNFYKNAATGTNPYGSDYRCDIEHAVRHVLVLAASPSEANIRPVLQSNLTLQPGEKFAILGVNPVHVGTEGAAVLGAAGFVFVADFQVRLPSPAPAPGAPGVALNVYIREPRKALVASASAAGVGAVLRANVTLASGELLDILSVKQFAEGSEAGAVWN